MEELYDRGATRKLKSIKATSQEQAIEIQEQ